MCHKPITHIIHKLSRYASLLLLLFCCPYMTCWIVTSIHTSIHPSVQTHTHTMNALCYRAHKPVFSSFTFVSSEPLFLTENELMNGFALNPNIFEDIWHAFLMPHQMKCIPYLYLLVCTCVCDRVIPYMFVNGWICSINGWMNQRTYKKAERNDM